MVKRVPTCRSTAARRRRPSTLKTVFQAAVLAVLLVPLGTVAMEAEPITCGFGTGEIAYGGEGCNAQEGEDFFSASSTTSRFDFGDYYLELMFELEDFANFQVQVTATEMTDTQFTYNAGEQFSDYECIEITQDGKCVNFLVEPLGVEQEGTWISYELEIHWNKILGQELDPALVRILHDIGPNGDGIYDEDMCETALSDDAYLDCEIDPDPGVRSGDTDFQNFTAALASTPLNVPEPSTLTLLAAGVGGILCRRRRRSVKSDVTPRA